MKSWKRTLRLDRAGNRVEVRDRFALAKAAKEITLSLMTPLPMKEKAPGVLSLSGAETGEVCVAFDSKAFRATQEEVPITDARLRGSWGGKLYRILLHAQNPGAEGDWTLRITQG